MLVREIYICHRVPFCSVFDLIEIKALPSAMFWEELKHNICFLYVNRLFSFLLSPPTSEAGVRFPARPQVGKLVVACRWSAVYSIEP